MPDYHSVYFGVDVEAVMTTFFHKVFVPRVIEEYGDKPFALIVLSNRVQHDWTNPFRVPSVLFRLSYGEQDNINGERGLLANVEHKLHFVLRTGLNSSEAGNQSHLVEPGDFPYAGAGTSDGFVGGVSGFTQEDDWRIYCKFAKALIKVRDAAAWAAIEECRIGVTGMKYLGGTPAEPEIYVPV